MTAMKKLLAAVLAVSMLGPTAEAADMFKSGSWKGFISDNPAVTCLMTKAKATTSPGIFVAGYKHDGTFWIGFYDPSFHLGVNFAGKAAVISNHGTFEELAKSQLNGNILVYEDLGDPKALESLVNGADSVYVIDDNGVYVDTTGSQAAMERLKACHAWFIAQENDDKGVE